MMRLQTHYILDVAPSVAGERILLLMLPGAKNTPQQLVDHGFIRALRERELPVDVLVLDAHVDLYLERKLVERLLHDTLDEVHAHGYRRICLLGISLGGTGAMLCATERTTEIESVFLLAPFLGTRGIVAEVAAAGGLQQWQAGEIDSRDHERALLERLKLASFTSGQFPTVYLGYGDTDRYRAASILLSERLPQHHVTVMSGGHDWETWVALWHAMLEKRPLR